MLKVAMLVVYFGKLPPFTDLFLNSCVRNEGIDFFLIGDFWNTVEGQLPDNCTQVGMDLEAFKVRIKNSTGVTPGFRSAYKVCDFRPAFALIFEDLLEGYDYWGACDTDIILGDIRSFLETVHEYDVFSTRAEFLSGPMFFMRHEERINKLFLKSKDYQKVFSEDRHYCFDECAFAWSEMSAGISIIDADTEVESMTEVVVKALSRGEITVHFATLSLEPKRSFPGSARYDNGRISKGGKAFIHYHHLHNKGYPTYTYPRWPWTQVPDAYRISRYGIYGYSGSRDIGYRLSQFCGRWVQRIKKRSSALSGKRT